MSVFTTPQDFWRKERRRQFDPRFASKHQAQSFVSTPFPQSNVGAGENMVNDPVLAEARAQESFYLHQYHAGYEVFQSGRIESAADEQNLRAFEDSQDKPEYGASAGQSDGDPLDDPKNPGYPSLYDGRLMDPRLMPGGGYGPVHTFQIIAMCLGGY